MKALNIEELKVVCGGSEKVRVIHFVGFQHVFLDIHVRIGFDNRSVRSSPTTATTL